jgi:hypothetical protein
MLNLAQFQASITFESTLIPLIGEVHKPLVGRILISDEDRNWDSVRELWTLKETVKKSPALRRAFDENETADGVLRALGPLRRAAPSSKDVDKYRNEYGNKSMYAPRVHLHDLAGEPDADHRGASRLSALGLRLRERRAPAPREPGGGDQGNVVAGASRPHRRKTRTSSRRRSISR